MQYVRLGASGVKVSRYALGCMSFGDKGWRPWVLEEGDSMPFFKAAIEKGINFLDTADAYSHGVSEEITGRAIREFSRRADVVLATKVCRPMGKGPNDKGLSRKHIMESIDGSLKRLGTDYVDLYVIHRFDYETPIEETLDALNDVVRAGKALYLGASSMLGTQFAQMLTMQRERGYAPFVSMQNYYNLSYREEEREMLPFCRQQGIAVTPYSPLARGFLAGNAPTQGQKTLRGETDKMAAAINIGMAEEDHVIADRLRVAAERLGASRASVALAWMLANPAVTAPLIGTTKAHHLDDALAALDLKLDAETVRFLEEPYRAKAVTSVD